MKISKKTLWISVLVHVVGFLLLGSWVVEHGQEGRRAEVTASIEQPTLVDDTPESVKEDMPELDAGGGNDKQMPPQEAPLVTALPEVITVTDAKWMTLSTPSPAAIPQIERGGFGSGTSSGNGSGTGTGSGTGSLEGMQVPLNTIVLLDRSPSMIEYCRQIYFDYSESFPNAKLITISSSDTKNVAEGIRYAVDELGATSIYLLTDFQDKGGRESTLVAIDTLTKKNVKLFICTAGKPPYEDLAVYAAKTGGVKTFGETFPSILKVEGDNLVQEREVTDGIDVPDREVNPLSPRNLVYLKTLRATKGTILTKGFLGTRDIPFGESLVFANYDSNLPNQKMMRGNMLVSIPTIDLEPGPVTPPEVLADANENREIVCSEFAAIKDFYKNSGSEPVGIIYCANGMIHRQYEIIDAIMASPDVTRTNLVVIMNSEVLAPATTQRIGLYKNRVYSNEPAGTKRLIDEHIKPDVQVAFIKDNPNNAIAYLLQLNVKKFLIVGSFTDPWEPQGVAVLRKLMEENSATLSLLSTPLVRTTERLMKETVPGMSNSLKPADPICAIVEKTGGIKYLSKSATQKQPTQIPEISIPLVR